MIIIRIRRNEPFEVALRRFKRIVEKSKLLIELKFKEFYEKPTLKRKRKLSLFKKKKKIYNKKKI